MIQLSLSECTTMRQAAIGVVVILKSRMKLPVDVSYVLQFANIVHAHLYR